MLRDWKNERCERLVSETIGLAKGNSRGVTGLRRVLRARLSPYKVPRRFLMLADDDVPMLSSGKLDAVALKERFGAG